jgi:thiol-disulfide isomerase/thioredoxin
MRRAGLQYYLRFFLALSFLSALSSAAQRAAPQFNVPALDGGSISNGSLSGNVTLLQFWTTWCPYCKSDQTAVDNIAAEFGSRGLSVIAIDVGEQEATVKNFLQKSPRSCTIGMDSSASVVSQFGGGGFPHYVVIDRQGNIVASRSGAAGEAGLRYLIGRAGLGTPKAGTVETADRGAPPPSGGVSPRWVTVPGVGGGTSAVPSKPQPKTIFILVSGEQLECDRYTILAGYVDVTVGDQQRRIQLSALDTKKTIAMNRQRGVDLKLPTNNREVVLGF